MAALIDRGREPCPERKNNMLPNEKWSRCIVMGAINTKPHAHHLLYLLLLVSWPIFDHVHQCTGETANGTKPFLHASIREPRDV